MKQGPDQIALPLDWPQSEGDARFIVSDANREAFEHFRKFSLWPVKATILTGPRRSGRTCSHEASSSGSAAGCSTRQTGATRRNCSMPGTRRRIRAGHWSWSPTRRRRRGPRSLPDLKTRLAITPVTRIGHPDDALFAALIQLHFADRGLHIPADALRFMSERLHRDYWTAERAVEAVDRHAIAERARLSLPTIRRALDRIEDDRRSGLAAAILVILLAASSQTVTRSSR